VDDAAFVSRIQRVDQLTRDVERFGNRQGTGLETLGESWSLDQLQHEPVGSPGLLDSVDCSHVGTVEGGQQSCLPLESRQSFGIPCETLGKHFDRHVAA